MIGDPSQAEPAHPRPLRRPCAALGVVRAWPGRITPGDRLARTTEVGERERGREGERDHA